MPRRSEEAVSDGSGGETVLETLFDLEEIPEESNSAYTRGRGETLKGGRWYPAGKVPTDRKKKGK